MKSRINKLQENMTHTGAVLCGSLGQKSNQLYVSGGEDKKICVCALGKPQALCALAGHSSPVTSVIFNKTEDVLVAGSQGGAIKVWDLGTQQVTRSLTSTHRSDVLCLDAHPFGEFFASGSMDCVLKLWDNRSKTPITSVNCMTGPIRVCRWSPDGKWVVTGSDDNVIKLWEVGTSKELHTFRLHEGPILCLDFHPEELILASGSADRTVKFWDCEKMTLASETEIDATPVRKIVFTDDGKHVLSCTASALKVWNWETGQCMDHVEATWKDQIFDARIFPNLRALHTISANQSSFVTVHSTMLNKLCPFNGRQRGASIPGFEPSPSPPMSMPSSTSPTFETGEGSGVRPPIVMLRDRPAPRLHTPNLAGMIPSLKTPDQQPVTAPQMGGGFNPDPSPPQPRARSGSTHHGGGGAGSASGSGKRSVSRPTSSPTGPFYSDESGRPGSDPGPEFYKKKSPAPKAVSTEIQTTLTEARPGDEMDLSSTGNHVSIGVDAGLPPPPPPPFYDPMPISPSPPKRSPPLPQPQQSQPFFQPPAAVGAVGDVIVIPSGPDARQFVPAVRQGPIGLDPQSIIKVPQGVPAEKGTSLRVDNQLIDMASKDFQAVCQGVVNRQMAFRVFRAFWQKGELRQAFENLAKGHDLGVSMDIFSRVFVAEFASHFSLDVCVTCLPLIIELTESQYEDHIIVGLRSATFLYKNFGQLIQSTLDSAKSGGIGMDLHFEARLEKSQKCGQAFEAIYNASRLKCRRTDVAGETARELCAAFESGPAR